MIIKLLSSETEAKKASKLFQETWQCTYKDILPDDFLAAIPENAWEKRFNRDGRYNLIFIDDDGKIRGVVSYGNPRDTEMRDYGELMALYVEPNFQRHNVGKTLLNAAENELKKMGYSKFYLWCLASNEKAKGFYEHFGWHNTTKEKLIEIAGKEYKCLLYQKKIHN